MTTETTIRSGTSAPPLYAQIADGLILRIQHGELAPGTRLPSERELSRQLGVNRMTLRQALQVLEDQGLLIRRQGDGTYVARPRIERAAGRLFPFTHGIRRRGYTPGARVVYFERRTAEATIARALNLPVGAWIYYSHRLRLINREPVMLERFALPLERFPTIERFDFTVRSIYEIMSTEYGVTISRARQSLEPVIATAYEAELLGVEAGAPLMLERRVTLDQKGLAVEYTKDLYRGDRFRFVTESAPVDW
jgi:GntR family transcriptional regulator